MAKGKIPPQFLKAQKKAAPAAAKGAKVIDPKGKSGTVTAVMGGMVKVKHTDGSTDVHPKGAVKKAAAPKKPKKS
jgi:hypothetical protein